MVTGRPKGRARVISERGVMTMAEVAKTAGVTAWTGQWRLPTDKRDHQRAVRKQRRKDRREVAGLRFDYRG